MPERLNSLDVARGIAALAVIFWHWQHFFMGSVGLESTAVAFEMTDQPFYNYFSAFYQRGFCAVMFFFVLSGFVFFWLYQESISNRQCSLRKFALLRFARLYPLHLVTLIAVAVLQWMYRSESGTEFVFTHNDTYHFALNLVGMTHWGLESGYSFNAPTWSVSVEIGLYAIFFAAAYWGHTTWRKVLGVVVVTIVLDRLRLGGPWVDGVSSFFLGGLTYFAAVHYLKTRTVRSDLVICLATLAVWFGFAVTGKAMFRIPVFPLTIMTLIITELRFARVFRPFVWIGDLTYSSYLLHFPLQIVFAIVVIKAGYDASVFYEPMSLVAFLSVLLPASWLTFHYFERPMQSWIRNLFTRRNVNALPDCLVHPGTLELQLGGSESSVASKKAA
ncbi:acyltransferase family protein [Novipirellula sp. SH528]|uniref:acyltransferase family protein n=1 Tax=Novipirellula sp. SH528 TaxID=3454466 RepID=UPI003FA1880F